MVAVLNTSFNLPVGYCFQRGPARGTSPPQPFIVQKDTGRAVPVALTLMAGDEPEDFDAYFLALWQHTE